MSFPDVYDLLKSDRTSISKDQLGMFSSTLLEERQVILLCVTGNPRHIRFLWVEEKLPKYFSQISYWDV